MWTIMVVENAGADFLGGVGGHWCQRAELEQRQ